MPALALAGKPRLTACRIRRIAPSSARRCSASDRAGSGEASSTTTMRLAGGIVARTLSMQSSVRRRCRNTGITTSKSGLGGRTAAPTAGRDAPAARRRRDSRSSSPGSSGLPISAPPSSARSWTGPGGSSAAGRNSRRGRASGMSLSTRSANASSPTSRRLPSAPSTVRSGTRSGSPGCHSQPDSAPPAASTKPSLRRIERTSSGLPSSGAPRQLTVRLCPCRQCGGSPPRSASPSSRMS